MESLDSEGGRLEMDEKKAREILGETILPNDNLFDLHNYIDWKTFQHDISLDGIFEPEDLEAIAWWMKNKGKGKKGE